MAAPLSTKYQSKVKVLVRVRPFIKDENKTGCITVRDKSIVEVTNPKFPTEVTKYTYAPIISQSFFYY